MTLRNRTILARTLPMCGALVLTAGWFAGAGDINPPAGPVAPTHKTLTEVEPRIAINASNTPGDADSLFKISQRGSYYLTGNIIGIIGRHGIEIAASNVTLDLNGFDLTGNAIGSQDGVSVTVANPTHITVVNGSVRNWVNGVNLGGSASGCRVDGILASGNSGDGIGLGSGGTVTNCTTSSNGGDGINAGFGGRVNNCSTFLNAGSGVLMSDSCMVTQCLAYSNTVFGFTTFVSTTGCTITDCTARSNGRDGMVFDSRCVIRDNTCISNGTSAAGGAGIHATGSDNRIEGNNCSFADRGIDVDDGNNIIIRNTCSGNTFNWVVAASNVLGPILDRTAPGSAAVNGNSAPDSTGSTHPNANFTY